ncbi:phosphoribosylanthranilate isomerase [Acetobacter conturbans]|uniref:N-(5'-phosphoribosyl)anthranilate isomerase n=1 Tax=Acetobacter conturbans TaxID=1737472 RepID=A0ABX0K620_9PROT|nr:N-(5'-phosphoribosyl)anthranilate isomerase [Acetobacter conturbans]
MTVGVKICGLTEEDGVDACLRFGADWIGLNFFTRSPRYVTATRAAELANRFVGRENRPGCVGLFVDPTNEEIAAVLDTVPVDILQLYTTAERAASIGQNFQREVWLSVPVSMAADLPVETKVERLVIESRAPKDADRPGGNGETLPWDVTQGWFSPCPWILAGGLNPDNVAEAILLSGAPAVDVSSGVECSPGIKDPEAVRRFIQIARSSGKR